jgi:exoribonuclease R
VPTRHLRLASTRYDDVADALAALRAELRLPPMFPAEVLAEAEAAARRDVAQDRQDRRDVEFVTIDPPGSMDLDQAVHVASSGNGYIVRYAIADVAAFVTPGSVLDAELHRRGMTVYGPDTRTPLHPNVLSEGAASLLPGEDRPAVLWTIGLDTSGEIVSAAVARALVRSRARLTYGEVQTALDAGTAPESLTLLADVGRLRQERERARGGVSLDVPEQEVAQRPDGSFELEFRRTLPVEGWNAQISLLTGIVAARLMREAGVGIYRTLPQADPRDVARLRRTARALGIDWRDDVTYGELIRSLESRRPTHAAFLNEATTLFRGADYRAFGMPGIDGAQVTPPDDAAHSAIAAEYAHVTAPLRRLVDRYGAEICVAHAAGRSTPPWVLDALPGLPETMARTGRRANAFERGCVDIVEAALLAGREGRTFDAVVVDVDDRREGDERAGDRPQRGLVILRDPAVRAPVQGTDLPLGERVRAKLVEADVKQRKVLFELA